MSKIIKKLHPNIIKKTAARCKERGIVIPTSAQMRDPNLIAKSIKTKLAKVGMWDVDPLNLFRIT